MYDDTRTFFISLSIAKGSGLGRQATKVTWKGKRGRSGRTKHARRTCQGRRERRGDWGR